MYHGQLVLTCNGQTSVVGGTYGCVDADINVLHEHPVVVHFCILGSVSSLVFCICAFLYGAECNHNFGVMKFMCNPFFLVAGVGVGWELQ